MRAALVLVVAACAPALPAPLPRVIATSPSGSVAPDAVSVEVALTAPLDPAGIVDGRWFALCRREDLRDVVRAVETEQGLAPGAPIVAAHAELQDGGRRAVLHPDAPLAPGQAWAAVLSFRARAVGARPFVDADGKARTVAVLFETGPAVDRTAPRPRWVLPPHGPVPSNARWLEVGFDEPIAVTPGDAASGSGQVSAVAPDLLRFELTAPLRPGPFAPDLQGIHDLAGNGADVLAPLEVSRCSADAPPLVAAVTPGDPGLLSARVQASLRGMGRLVAEVRVAPGAPACGAVPPPPGVLVVRGDVSSCSGWDPCRPDAVECPGSVTIGALCPGQDLLLRVATEDLAGHQGSFRDAGTVAALPPRPEPVVTEVLADADAPESGGEYVEVANLGTGEVDLAGHFLEKRTTSGRRARCTLSAVTPVRVAPGAHALIVGGAYDGRYALPPATPVYRCGPTALDGGLANGEPVAVALLDPAGATLSTAGLAEPVERCATGALERVHPAGPDAAANWACPGSRSPGACNAATPPPECPRRPW